MAGPSTYGGWNADCDRALLLGIARHGFSNWEAILSDESLKFPAPGNGPNPYGSFGNF